jgi:multiple sugar transport system permease protein
MRSSRTYTTGRWRKKVIIVLTYMLLCVLSFIVLFPILWLVSSALKSPDQQYQWPPQLIPWPIYLNNFTRLLEVMPLGSYILNSTLVATVSVIGMCISSSMAAYAFARMRFRGRDWLFSILLGTLMIPYAITLIPTFYVMTQVKLIDTFWPLIMPNLFGSAFMIFLLRQAFRGIPQDLVDAAKIDGATDFQVFSRIFIPLSMPTLITVALLTFLWSWNDLLGPLIFINNPNLFTVQRGLAMLTGRSGTGVDRRGVIMAGSLLGMLPMLVIYLVGQRYFIRGLSRSGIKG